MAAEGVTEVTNVSWFERIGQSIRGVLVGLVLFLGSFVLLFWNEGRAVDRFRDLAEGRGAVVSVAVEQLDPSHEGKLIHITGPATTEDTLRDPLFALSREAIALRRSVEMYQWQEDERRKTEKQVGGGERTVTHYEYDKTWASRPIDSSQFKDPTGHDNPPMPFQGLTQYASLVRVGAFRLTEALVREINAFEPIPATEEMLESASLDDELRDALRVDGEQLYMGDQPRAPTVGGLRVRFASVSPPVEVSVVGVQSGDSFTPYLGSSGTSVLDLRVGALTAEQMFDQLEHENRVLTWVLRGVGFLLMAVGLGLVFAPIAVVADVLPFAGDLLRFGITLFSGVVAFALSLTTIAFAWLFYRPLLGIPLLLVAVAGIGALWWAGRKRRPTSDQIFPDASPQSTPEG